MDPARPDTEPVVIPFLLPGAGPHPLVVVCPGGGYGGRAPHEADPIAEWLNRAGVSALVLHYRVAPYRHPVPWGDAQRAIRLARANAATWRLDPARIGILGFSAGGHLACTAGVHHDPGQPAAADPVERQSSRPDLMILCYPVISLHEFGHTGSMHNLLGQPTDEKLREHLSLHRRAGATTAPAFIWHTADDAGVPAMNALMLAQALAVNKVPYALHVFPKGHHGLGLAPNDAHVSQWTRLCELWLRSRGF